MADQRDGRFVRTQMEVPAPRRGRPGYRWAPAWKIVTAQGEVQPYFRSKGEARQVARDIGITIVSEEMA